MGAWSITIQGTGPHHNNAEYDAESLLASWVAQAHRLGHTISHSSFTWGGTIQVGAKKPVEEPEILGVEELEVAARLLHESFRDTVSQGKVDIQRTPIVPFTEWDDLTESAKEGRRLVALYLHKNGVSF